MVSFLLTIPILIALVSISFVPLLSYLFRGWMALYDPYSINFRYGDVPNLHGKLFVVTGANTGLGKEMITVLAEKGARVIATTRDDKRGQEALASIRSRIGDKSSLIKFMNLNLASFKSVKNFARNILEENAQIDVLVLNAGVMLCPYSETEDGYELQIGTNHLGHFLLTNLLLKTLVRSKARVVTISSLAHKLGYPDGIDFKKFRSNVGYDKSGAYGQSKLANLLFANELARRTKGTGLTSNSLHPGTVTTDLQRHLLSDSAISSYISIISSLLDAISMDVKGGVLTQLYVATSKDLEGVTGKYFHPIAETEPSLQAQNETLQRQLWEYSVEAVKDYLDD